MYLEKTTFYLLTANYYNGSELVYSIVKGYTPWYKKAVEYQEKLQAGFIATEGLNVLCVTIQEIDEL